MLLAERGLYAINPALAFKALPQKVSELGLYGYTQPKKPETLSPRKTLNLKALQRCIPKTLIFESPSISESYAPQIENKLTTAFLSPNVQLLDPLNPKDSYNKL